MNKVRVLVATCKIVLAMSRNPIQSYPGIMETFFVLVCSTLLIGAAATNAVGRTFLEANAQRPGVVVLPSGLQYKQLTTGSGQYHPSLDSPCMCHYEGRTAQQYPEGATFDSSYQRGRPARYVLCFAK